MFFCNEINRLRSKGVSNIFHSEKLMFSTQNFPEKLISWKENLNKCTSFGEQKGIFEEMFILALLSSAVFCLQSHVLDFF